MCTLKIEYCKTKLVLEEVIKKINELEGLLNIKYNQNDYEKLGVYRKKEVNLNNELLKIQGLIDNEVTV